MRLFSIKHLSKCVIYRLFDSVIILFQKIHVAGKAVSMLSGLTKIIKHPLFLQSHYNFSCQVSMLKIKKIPFHHGHRYELSRDDSSSVFRHCMQL